VGGGVGGENDGELWVVGLVVEGELIRAGRGDVVAGRRKGGSRERHERF
jgi:hypothetical protein